jgi:hypothetical protein
LLKKVYFISGLGADKRVFSKLDLNFCQPVYLDWIPPHHHELLKDYALRLKKQIDEEAPCIVGISFGGMLVTEMAKADPTSNCIIISSNKIASEFPSHLRLARYFPAYQWMPASALRRLLIVNSWILGGKGKEQKEILRGILMDTDINFTKWAIGSILGWKNEEVPSNLVHIHGTADKLLPYKYVKADYCVDGGSHIMTLDNFTEVSTILKKLILQ